MSNPHNAVTTITVNLRNGYVDGRKDLLIADLIKQGKPVYQFSLRIEDSKVLVDIVREENLELVLSEETKRLSSFDSCTAWAKPGIVLIETTRSKEDEDWYVEDEGICIVGNDVEVFNRIKEKLLPFLKKEVKNTLSFLSHSDGSLHCRDMPKAGMPLVRENYTDLVLKQYDHVVQDLNQADPCGRLVLIMGPPGTGKGHICKALLNDVEAKFILVPAGMIEEISNPRSISFLVDQSKRDGRPLILLVEDADSVLVPRQADNMGAISALLNLTDGFYGQLLNLRVVATTNASKLELDKAAVRSGRLCARMDVNLLSSTHANAVYSRLVKDKTPPFTRETALAEVYRRAKEDTRSV